ncbi:MAG: hypothetical protein SGI74_06225 [Oligoflexia bacterium]|nr:hypothetical protein [Oligoflexia bacterium]
MKYLVFVVSVGFAFGCSDARLAKQIQAASVKSEGYFCTQAPQISNGITKFMFVIDKSGSNVDTDPGNAKRADNIERFFNSPASSPRRDNPNIAWGYIAFAGSSATAFINDGNDQNPTFVGVPNNIAAMNNALALQRGPDNDLTPYRAAIALTKKAIINDQALHPNETHNYVVFFVSDGRPTDYGAEGPAGADAFSDVDDLVNTIPGKITFSTAYYGAFDPATADGLKQMAEHGHGKFVDTNAMPDFEIDDLLNNAGAHADTYQVNKILVYNLNSAVCLDKKRISLDSDADGLCDDDETYTTKTDPQNRFSKGDGYGDYFHYISKVTGGSLPVCYDRTDEDFDLLTACEELYMYNEHPTGTKLNRADAKNPDTDFDWFIDGIEYLMLKNRSSALDMFNVFKSYDGEPVNAGEQITQHRNPLFYDYNMAPTEMYDTRIEFDKYNDQGQSCYRFKQDNLKLFHTKSVSAQNSLGPLYAHKEWDNTVLIYYIQSLEKDPTGAGYYAYSVQTLSGNPGTIKRLGRDSGLQVRDGTFTLYQIPEPAKP